MKRDGRFLEKLGHYDPVPDPPVIKIDLEKVESWVQKGAKPSEKVQSLMRRMSRPEFASRPKKAKTSKTSEPDPAEEPQPAAQSTDTAETSDESERSETEEAG
jgi:small subunit ribosomal protein S16